MSEIIVFNRSSIYISLHFFEVLRLDHLQRIYLISIILFCCVHNNIGVYILVCRNKLMLVSFEYLLKSNMKHCGGVVQS